MQLVTDWAQILTAIAAVSGVMLGWILARQANREAEDRFVRAQEQEHDRLTKLLADENLRAEAVRRSENERFEASTRHAFELQRLPIIIDAQARVLESVQDLSDRAESLVVRCRRGECTDTAEARDEITQLTRQARSELNRFQQICALGWVSAAADYYTLWLHNGVVSIEQNLVPEVFEGGGEVPLRDPLGMLSIIWPDTDAPPPGVPSITETLKASGALDQLNQAWAHDDAMATLLALNRIMEIWEQSVADTIVEVHGTPLDASRSESIEMTREQHELLDHAALAFDTFAWQYADAVRTQAARTDESVSKWPEFRQVTREDLVSAAGDASDALQRARRVRDLDPCALALLSVAAHSVEWVTSARDVQVSEDGTLKMVESWPDQPRSDYEVRPETDNHGMAVIARSASHGPYLRIAAALHLVANRLRELLINATVTEPGDQRG